MEDAEWSDKRASSYRKDPAAQQMSRITRFLVSQADVSKYPVKLQRDSCSHYITLCDTS